MGNGVDDAVFVDESLRVVANVSALTRALVRWGPRVLQSSTLPATVAAVDSECNDEQKYLFLFAKSPVSRPNPKPDLVLHGVSMSA